MKKLKSSEPNGLLGIYDGEEFVFYGSKWKLVNYIKLVWRYGLFDLYTMDTFITNMLKNFSNIYKLQENHQAFNSVPEMLKAMGGEQFYEYTQQTIRQTLENIGLNPLLIDELVTAVMRINYGQDVTLNGFAGKEADSFASLSHKVKEKSAHEPSAPHHQSLSRFPKH